MFVEKGLLRTSAITSLTVYRIKTFSGLYFRWCYIDDIRCAQVCEKLKHTEHNFSENNWTHNPDHTVLSQVERLKILKAS